MRKTKNSILAIDPGTREMGYACFHANELEDYGVKSIRHVARAVDVFDAVQIVTNRLIQQKRPHVLVIEKNSFSQIQQNLRLTLSVSRLKAAARRHRIRVFEFDPKTIRKIVCGDGNATKRELARTLTVRYPELRAYLESNRRWRERYYQNAFDAIGCGLTYIAMSTTFSVSGRIRLRNGRK